MGGWVDIMCKDILEGWFYSWWSYCVKDWDVVDKGWCLDYVWVMLDIFNVGYFSCVLCDVCGWEKLSDYVLVFVIFDI